MYNYLKGTVQFIESDSIALETNGIGYKIYVANPYSFMEGEETTVFVYHQVKEDIEALFGFKTREERDLFLKLLNVKGLGTKVGIGFFATGSVSGIVDAIDRENVLYLKKFPKVGDKLAKQIVLDLKGKLGSIDITTTSNNDSFELISVLESLGYKTADISKIVPNVDKSKTIEEQVKDALKLLLK